MTVSAHTTLPLGTSVRVPFGNRGGIHSVSRPKHGYGEYEKLFKRLERSRWRVEGGGNRHFVLKCPCERKCMIVVSSTPQSRTGQLAIVHVQLRNKTCWKEE